MKNYIPSIEEVKAILQKGDSYIVPMSLVIPKEMLTPIQVLEELQKENECLYMLESMEENHTCGRYSFIGYNPILALIGTMNKLRIYDLDSATFPKEQQIENPKEFLKEFFAKYKSHKYSNLPPFTGGLVGYFGFEYFYYSEPTIVRNQNQEELPDFDLMLFDQVIAFDHFENCIYCIANVGGVDIGVEYKKALDKLNTLEGLLEKIKQRPSIKDLENVIPSGRVTSEFRNLFKKEDYILKVNKTKSYIQEGDIFQLVLANGQEAEFEGSLLTTYKNLQKNNPSPYLFYFKSLDIEIAGASPETLVKLTDGILKTVPLAGTRPRGITQEEDLRLEKELLMDPKELAEHNMLVDLGRNDLGKISEFGTVKLEKYKKVERYSKVMHIASSIVSNIRSDKGALDAIDVVLPAGTLSGAPKIRACQIISELEGKKRGVYGGAIGYLDFAGNMDTCIAIRMAYKRKGKVYIRSGAGIVADSIPENEYDECNHKARAVMEAVNGTEILEEGVKKDDSIN